LGYIPRCLQRLKSIAMKSSISGNSSKYPVRLRRGCLLGEYSQSPVSLNLLA